MKNSLDIINELNLFIESEQLFYLKHNCNYMYLKNDNLDQNAYAFKIIDMLENKLALIVFKIFQNTLNITASNFLDQKSNTIIHIDETEVLTSINQNKFKQIINTRHAIKEKIDYGLHCRHANLRCQFERIKIYENNCIITDLLCSNYQRIMDICQFHSKEDVTFFENVKKVVKENVFNLSEEDIYYIQLQHDICFPKYLIKNVER